MISLPYFRPGPKFYTLLQTCKGLLRFAYTFKKGFKFAILFKIHFSREENNLKSIFFAKTKPNSRPDRKNLTLFYTKMVKIFTHFSLRRLENYIPWRRTYLSSSYKGVPRPSPPGGRSPCMRSNFDLNECKFQQVVDVIISTAASFSTCTFPG